tara:strand:+ start:1312 stop:1737 length:426 start_codon:yes stop_codon:yes gene_type:complete
MYLDFHPVITHFPIALIVLSYGFQIITVIKPTLVPKNLTMWVLIPAALSTIPSAISGNHSAQKLNDICLEARQILINHERFANITTWGTLLLTLVWIWITLNKKADQKAQELFLAFFTLIFISVCITGFLGGELVHIWKVD